MKFRAALLLFLSWVIFVAACGGSSSTSKESGTSYTSVDAIAAKLRAAHLGCLKWLGSGGDVEIEGLPKPEDSNMCEVGTDGLGKIDTQIVIYKDAATMQRVYQAGERLGCAFHPKKWPYQVTGANWQLGTGYYATLARRSRRRRAVWPRRRSSSVSRSTWEGGK